MTKNDRRGNTDAFLASAWIWGDPGQARNLLESDPSLSGSNIHAACAAGDAEAVTRILETDPAAATAKGGPRDWEPILYASWSCFLPGRTDEMVRVLKLLLKHGADPDSYWVNESDWKESALYGCVENNSVPAARVLVDAGANPNDNESLYHACEKFNLESAGYGGRERAGPGSGLVLHQARHGHDLDGGDPVVSGPGRGPQRHPSLRP